MIEVIETMVIFGARTLDNVWWVGRSATVVIVAGDMYPTEDLLVTVSPASLFTCHDRGFKTLIAAKRRLPWQP